MKLGAFLSAEYRNDIEYETLHNRPLLEFYKEVDNGIYDDEIKSRIREKK